MLFDDFLKNFDKELNSMFDSPEYRMIINASQDPKGAHIEFELAGIGKDNISVEYKGQVLDITYVDRFGKKRIGGRYIVSEQKYDRTKTVCKYEDGLLTIDIPPKSVPVEDPLKVEIK